MRRYLIAVAGILVMVAPALAQDAASGTGRYQITPSEQGFTRLDTRTGALSHCTKQAGVWRCKPLADQSGLGEKLDDLSGQVGQLSTDLDALTARVDALATRVDALAARPTSTGLDALAARVDTLTTRVDALATRPTSTSLDALAGRVDALTTRVDALTARPSAEAAPAQDQAGLVEKAVRRLFDMVRAMKHAEVGSI